MLRALAITLLLTGCAEVDLDQDGSPADEDCNDNDGTIFPGAPEICDGVDQDCDGAIDEAALDARSWFTDRDGDGSGANVGAVYACGRPDEGYAAEAGDCDDNDPSVYPRALEQCDGKDQDCNGLVDDGLTCIEADCGNEVDDDGDGLIDCVDPDCDGTCPEVCDDDRDNDGDGELDCADESCWDAPTCVETTCIDGVDNEADGLVDCDDPDCWGLPECPDVLWRVTGGSLALTRRTTRWTETDCDDCDSGVDRLQEVLTFEVQGELERFTGETWRTCRWSYDRGRYEETIENGVATAYDVERQGFTLEAGCGVTDARFLPRRLIRVGDALHTLHGEPWFVGDLFEDSTRDEPLDERFREGTVTSEVAFLDPLRPPPVPLGLCAEGAPGTGYVDVDEDGVGQRGIGIATCGDRDLLHTAGDCDDGDPGLPAEDETCANGIDDDCDRTAACPGPAGEQSLEVADFVLRVDADAGTPRIFSLGDIDYDERDDFAVGLPFDDSAGEDAGAVVLVLGSELADGRLTGPRWTGISAGDLAGAAVAPAGDQTGDGVPDLLVSATGAVVDGVANSGAVYVVDWPLTGGSLADAAATIETPGAWTGTAVANLDDLDSDGLDDLAVGAQTDDTGGTNAGAVHVFRGPVLGHLALSDATWTITGSRNDIVGDALASAGDVDGDGRADLLIGHRKGGVEEAGAAHLFLSPLPALADLADADASWTGHLDDAWAGEHVSAAGDVDGDGYDDVLVAAPRTWGYAPRPIASTGEVYLIAGSSLPEDAPLRDARTTLRGDRIYDFAGAAISGGRDLDGDGRPDVAIGAPGDDRGARNGGVVAVFTDLPPGTLRLADAEGRWRGATDGAQAGTRLALTGDLDGDGFDDLVVVTWSDEEDAPGPRILGLFGGEGW